MNEPLVKLSGVSKSYRNGKLENRVLDDLYMQVQPGELLAVVGTSGSGKSTLLNIIGGLDPVFTGDVQVAGLDLSRMSDRRLSRFRNEHVGFVFQQFNLLDHLTCGENVAIPSVFSRKAAGSITERVEQALARVGMEQRINDRPTNLSGGQKQRIAIARALFNNPPLLLCDEPTGNLDRTTGRQIIELFETLNSEGGCTLIIVTHESRVSGAADRIIELEDGRFRENTKFKTRNMEPGTGNGDGQRGTGNEERGTGNEERGTGNEERGTGNEERGTGNGERGTGNAERGTGSEDGGRVDGAGEG